MDVTTMPASATPATPTFDSTRSVTVEVPPLIEVDDRNAEDIPYAAEVPEDDPPGPPPNLEYKPTLAVDARAPDDRLRARLLLLC